MEDAPPAPQRSTTAGRWVGVELSRAPPSSVHRRVRRERTSQNLGIQSYLRRWDWAGCQEGSVVPGEEVRLDPGWERRILAPKNWRFFLEDLTWRQSRSSIHIAFEKVIGLSFMYTRRVQVPSEKVCGSTNWPWNSVEHSPVLDCTGRRIDQRVGEPRPEWEGHTVIHNLGGGFQICLFQL